MTTDATRERTSIAGGTLSVSPLCLGGNVFGWTIDERASFAVLDAFVEGGGNFIDTADSYSYWIDGHRGGESETVVGNWMRSRGVRDDVVVATKVGMQMPDGTGLAPDRIARSVEQSLARLQVDSIDLYYAHRDDPGTSLDDTLEAFDRLVRDGTVRALGASNYDAERLAAALQISRERGFAAFQLLQPEYNLVARDTFEGPLQHLCVREGIDVVPYYALASGFLTGKYRDGAPVPDSPRAGGVMQRFGNARGWRTVDALQRIAARHDATPAQVALAWLRAQPAVAAPIASATSPQQVAELLGSIALQLSGEDFAELDAAALAH